MTKSNIRDALQKQSSTQQSKDFLKKRKSMIREESKSKENKNNKKS